MDLSFCRVCPMCLSYLFVPNLGQRVLGRLETSQNRKRAWRVSCDDAGVERRLIDSHEWE